MKDQTRRKLILLGFVLRRVALAIADIVIINVSYFLALLIRFYVNGQFRAIAGNRYVPAFKTFAPWYTVIAMVIFAVWGLYSRRWKKAGLRDFNRVLFANLCTAVVMVVGTLVFVMRMPLTYYFIGAVLQLVLTAMVRFMYRFFIMEAQRLGKKEIVVVATGLAANHVLSTIAEPVFVDGKRYESGKKALLSVGADMMVKSMSVREGLISLVTETKTPHLNDTSWAKDDEDVSFF